MEQDIMAERARVAREIHDGIAQQIAALGYDLDALSTHPGVNPLARVETRRIRAELSETLLDLRERMHHLAHDPITLRSEIESLFAHLGIPAHLDIHEERLPDGTGWQVHAIVHEAVRNIAQHSHATEAWCQYSASPQSVQIIIPYFLKNALSFKFRSFRLSFNSRIHFLFVTITNDTSMKRHT